MKLVKNIYKIYYDPSEVWKGNEKILCTVPSKSILKAVYPDHMEFEQVLEDEPTNNTVGSDPTDPEGI